MKWPSTTKSLKNLFNKSNVFHVNLLLLRRSVRSEKPDPTEKPDKRCVAVL